MTQFAYVITGYQIKIELALSLSSVQKYCLGDLSMFFYHVQKL